MAARGRNQGSESPYQTGKTREKNPARGAKDAFTVFHLPYRLFIQDAQSEDTAFIKRQRDH